MTDKELLELAAKAAGLNVKAVAENSDDIFIGLITGPRNKRVRNLWNPLDDDGDAFRLAVDLGMNVDVCNVKKLVNVWHGDFLNKCAKFDVDKKAATRRAIVRAAAAIGVQK